MKITVVYQYFGTKKSGWSTRFYDFAKEWVKNGNEVRVITSPYYKTDIKSNGFLTNIVIDGIKVTVINAPDSNLFSFFKRAKNSLLFSFISSVIVLFDRADTVIFSSGPITVLIPFFVKRLFSKKKVIIEHRDLWPDGAIEMGLLAGWKANMARVWVNWCNQKADHVVVCSEGMKAILWERGIRAITSIPHGCDLTLRDLDEEIILPHWTEGAIVFLYAGSLGLMDAVDEAIDGFIKTNLSENVHLVILGTGAEEQYLKEKAINSAKSSNIHFYGLVSKNVMVQWYRIAYASFVLFKKYTILSSSSPNKLFDSLVFGVPIIHNTQGWIKELVAKSVIGYNVVPNSSESMSDIIKRSIDNKELHGLMRDNAKQMALKSMNRGLMAEKYLDVFNT